MGTLDITVNLPPTPHPKLLQNTASSKHNTYMIQAAQRRNTCWPHKQYVRMTTLELNDLLPGELRAFAAKVAVSCRFEVPGLVQVQIAGYHSCKPGQFTFLPTRFNCVASSRLLQRMTCHSG